jgi:PhnB protein
MSLAPWIEVPDGERALDWYKAALGAAERYRADYPDGRLAVAQLAVGDADFWIQDDPESRAREGGGPIRMILTVQDPDAAFAQAVAAGATVINEVYEGHGWRIGRLADPFGHHWEVGRPL